MMDALLIGWTGEEDFRFIRDLQGPLFQSRMSHVRHNTSVRYCFFNLKTLYDTRSL